jgi:hypothetical protein
MAEFKTDQEIYQMAYADWMAVLSRLWKAANRPVDAEQLQIYIQELGEVPLGLLQKAISRAMQENQYSNVPTIGKVWEAVRRELGNPYDVRLAINEWTLAQPKGISSPKDWKENEPLPCN